MSCSLFGTKIFLPTPISWDTLSRQVDTMWECVRCMRVKLHVLVCNITVKIDRRNRTTPSCRLTLCICFLSVEALHLGTLMAAHGYFFPISDHVLTLKDDGTFYRFQVRRMIVMLGSLFVLKDLVISLLLFQCPR